MIAFYVLAAMLLALIVAVITAAVRGASFDAQRDAEALDPRRQLLFARLADLEFEYQTGKIGEEEYRQLREPLARAALEARSELEGSEGSSGLATEAGGAPTEETPMPGESRE